MNTDIPIDADGYYDRYRNRIILCDLRYVKAFYFDSGKIEDLFLSTVTVIVQSINTYGDILIYQISGKNKYYTLFTHDGQTYKFEHTSHIALTQNLLLIWGSDHPPDIPGYKFITVDPNFYRFQLSLDLIDVGDKSLFYNQYQIGIIDFNKKIKHFYSTSIYQTYGINVDYYENFVACSKEQIVIYNPSLIQLGIYEVPDETLVFGKYMGFIVNDCHAFAFLPYTIWSPDNHKFYSRFHPEITTMMTLSTIVPYLNLMPLELWSLIFSEF